MKIIVNEQRSHHLVLESQDLGIMSKSQVLKYFREFPWDREQKRMVSFAKNEPEIERSAPTVTAENLTLNELVFVSAGNITGQIEYEVSLCKPARRKRFWLFGSMVINNSGWSRAFFEDYEMVNEILTKFLDGELEPLNG